MYFKMRREDVDFSWCGSVSGSGTKDPSIHTRLTRPRSSSFETVVWLDSFIPLHTFCHIASSSPLLTVCSSSSQAAALIIPLWSGNLSAHNHPRHLDSSGPPRRHGPASPIPPACNNHPKTTPHTSLASGRCSASASADLFTPSIWDIQPALFFHHSAYLSCSRIDPDSQSATLDIRYETVRVVVVVVPPGDTPPSLSHRTSSLCSLHHRPRGWTPNRRLVERLSKSEGRF
jgi:hypothetical protein